MPMGIFVSWAQDICATGAQRAGVRARELMILIVGRSGKSDISVRLQRALPKRGSSYCKVKSHCSPNLSFRTESNVSTLLGFPSKVTFLMSPLVTNTLICHLSSIILQNKIFTLCHKNIEGGNTTFNCQLSTAATTHIKYDRLFTTDQMN